MLAPAGSPAVREAMTVVNARSSGEGDSAYDLGSVLEHEALDRENLEVDGRSVITGVVDDPDTGGFHEVVVERGRDLALDYRSPTLDIDDLIALDRETTVDLHPAIHRHRPPGVSVPGGWTTVGEASPHFVAALGVCCGPSWPSGVYGAHVEAFPDRGPWLTVMTIPSFGSDVAAALGWMQIHRGGRAEAFLIDGRPAVFLAFYQRYTLVVTTTDWGDLLVVRALRGRGPAPEFDITSEDLVAVASSVERLD